MGSSPSCGCCGSWPPPAVRLARWKRRLQGSRAQSELLEEDENGVELRRDRMLSLADDPRMGTFATYRRRSSTLSQDEIQSMEDFQAEFLDCLEQDELEGIVDFQEQFLDCSEDDGALIRVPSERSKGPWGDQKARGGDKNAWDDIDAESFNVRGTWYISDRVKEASAASLVHLLFVDLFESTKDIQYVTTCAAAGTLQRLRASGEARRLLLVHFRVDPMHMVMAYAVPPAGRRNSPAQALLARFMSDGMDDAERSRRLKCIPRVVCGPWFLRHVLSETPGVLGKNIPIEYHMGDNEFEVSINVLASPVGQRLIKRLIKPALPVLSVAVAFVVEGVVDEELPEQVLGGFMVTTPDPASARLVDP